MSAQQHTQEFVHFAVHRRSHLRRLNLLRNKSAKLQGEKRQMFIKSRSQGETA